MLTSLDSIGAGNHSSTLYDMTHLPSIMFGSRFVQMIIHIVYTYPLYLRSITRLLPGNPILQYRRSGRAVTFILLFEGDVQMSKLPGNGP